MKSAITIVSGLPRSGTSMIMRMIDVGGMEVLVDNIRKADEDNPNGYYEFEKVKKIKEDHSWIEKAEDKAFKMVSMLLYHLPLNRKYKIVFMKRIMGEILLSQQRMLERIGGYDKSVSNEEIGKLFDKHLSEIEKWLEKQDNMEVLYLSYNDIIKNSLENAQILNKFLDNKLDVEKMIQVVDRSLYRQKSKLTKA